MDESILESVKKDIGAFVENEDESAFDSTIIRYINSVFFILHQLGIGPANGYKITGPKNTWGEYISDSENLELVKTYMSMKVGLMFDPPSSSFVGDARKMMCDEAEWRLNVAVDPFNLK